MRLYHSLVLIVTLATAATACSSADFAVAEPLVVAPTDDAEAPLDGASEAPGDPDLGLVDSGVVPPADTVSPPLDTGTVHVDAGAPDTWTPPVDTGAPDTAKLDAVTLPLDTGAAPTDTGTPPVEAGTLDAGPPVACFYCIGASTLCPSRDLDRACYQACGLDAACHFLNGTHCVCS